MRVCFYVARNNLSIGGIYEKYTTRCCTKIDPNTVTFAALPPKIILISSNYLFNLMIVLAKNIVKITMFIDNKKK
ncbi:hypothetical protein SCO01_12120 [Staphylococcus cohnii subsp. cohnii]|nr:hypothetical protein SCO01_12120 [Staphylococcus cohnii subsp. cohnii]